MDTVERLRFLKLDNEVTGNLNPGITIVIKATEDGFRYGQLGDFG